MSVAPTILFIDDDQFFLEFYRAELSKEKISTHFAHDGKEGLEKAIKIKPDIILLDIILPKMDGFEVLEQLKSNAATRDIPVIIISVLGLEEDVNKMHSLGAVKTFNKLTSLPKDLTHYIKTSLETGKFEQNDKKIKTTQKSTTLDDEQVKSFYKEALMEMQKTLFSMLNKKIIVKDISISLVPYFEFKERVQGIEKIEGAIMVYGEIQARVPGIAMLIMNNNDTLIFMDLFSKSLLGNDVYWNVEDPIIEEFFNIVVNSFLNKIGDSLNDILILEPPIVSSANYAFNTVQKMHFKKKDAEPIVYMEQSFLVEGYGIDFSIFIIFGSPVTNSTKK